MLTFCSAISIIGENRKEVKIQWQKWGDQKLHPQERFRQASE